MSETPTTTTTIDADTWRDGSPFDATKAAELITTLRGVEKAGQARIRQLESGIRALAAGQTVDTTALGVTDPTANDLSAVAAILGADASNPASVVEAATQARLSGELYGIMADAGADPKLTRAVLNDSRALVGIDLGEGLHDRLTTLVNDVVKAHPQLKRQQFPATSGAPFARGSGGSPPPITPDVLAMMKPEDVVSARRAGLIPGVGKG